VFVQKFAQSDSPAGRGVGKDPQRPEVLASFQFEQRGREIRIVDGDGSVYTGAIEEVSAPSSTAKPDQRTTGRLSADKAQVEIHSNESPVGGSMATGALPPAVSFRVRGTNATLRQVVVFVGGVQPQAGVSQLGTSSRAGGITALSQPPPGPNQFLDTRITGRARLADGTELEINALPTPP
jgi:hypothetical protein